MSQAPRAWVLDGQCIQLLYHKVLKDHGHTTGRVCQANLEDHIPLYINHILGIDTTATVDPDLIASTMRLLSVSANDAESIAMQMGLRLGHHIELAIKRRLSYKIHAIHYSDDGSLYITELGIGYDDDFKVIQELIEHDLRQYGTRSNKAQSAYVRACALNYINNTHLY